jgi:hypothetical protein
MVTNIKDTLYSVLVHDNYIGIGFLKTHYNSRKIDLMNLTVIFCSKKFVFDVGVKINNYYKENDLLNNLKISNVPILRPFYFNDKKMFNFNSGFSANRDRCHDTPLQRFYNTIYDESYKYIYTIDVNDLDILDTIIFDYIMCSYKDFVYSKVMSEGGI